MKIKQEPLPKSSRKQCLTFLNNVNNCAACFVEAPRRMNYLSLMKFLLLFSSLLLAVAVQGQATRQKLTKNFTSPERKAILEAVKQKLRPDLNLFPKMVVESLVLKNGFAFFKGRVKNPDGQDIDFLKTTYKQALKDGVFDGDGTMALLKKSVSGWKVLAYAIGPTDVAWACWWKEFKAPKDIFDYAENCE